MTARGESEHRRSDNGAEFTSKAVQDRLRNVEVRTLFIEPGSRGRTSASRVSTGIWAMNCSTATLLSRFAREGIELDDLASRVDVLQRAIEREAEEAAA